MDPAAGIKVTFQVQGPVPFTVTSKPGETEALPFSGDGVSLGEQREPLEPVEGEIPLSPLVMSEKKGTSGVDLRELSAQSIMASLSFPLMPAGLGSEIIVTIQGPGSSGQLNKSSITLTPVENPVKKQVESGAVKTTGASTSEPPPAAVEPVPYQKASSLEEVRQQAANMEDMAKSMIAKDREQVLGSLPGAMTDRFMIDAVDPDTRMHLREAHQISSRLLESLSHKILGTIKDGNYSLHCNRVSIKHLGDAKAQHAGYVAGVLNRLPNLSQHPNLELSRLLLLRYFDDELNDTTGAKKESREFLADELAKATGSDPKVRDFVLSKDQDGLFAPEACTNDRALLYNLASHWAGDATMQFAAKLLGGDDRKAAAFVKQIFKRPDADLQQMMRDPNGFEGLVLNFAAMAHHEAWEWAKLGSACVSAAEGDTKAVDIWNHKDIMETRQLVSERSDSACKVSDQIRSYMLREDLLVPCQREGEFGEMPLSRLLDMIETRGIYTDDGSSRVLSPFAVRVKNQLHEEVKQAASVSDWHVGAQLTADVVANTCAAFASHAVDADYEKRDSLISLYRNGIGKFSPQIDKLLKDGVPNAKDDAYQSLYQEMAGEFGFEALSDHMGVGKANELVNNSTLADIIPIACKTLRLPMRAEYTSEQMVKDMEAMKGSLLKDDYFMSKSDFVEELRNEAQRPKGSVDAGDLENGIRIPNAIWMWTQLLRGLVEKKPGRYTGEEADMSSDKFPGGVQFNPPDVRDVELFTWARHRLEVQGHEPRESTRMALALIVLTQYKDLLQLRKAA